MVRWLILCGLLCACGCDQLEETTRSKRVRPKLLNRSDTANSPAQPIPPATAMPKKPLLDGPFAVLKTQATAEFTNGFVLIGVHKKTDRHVFQPVEKIEVDLQTSKDNPQQIHGIVRLYATQPLGNNLPDIQHEFALVYEYSPPQWFRTQDYEHSWSVQRAGLTNPAEQDWNYDVDFEIKRTSE
jgi:hypothetical protein